jgi:hypothetical protein
MKKMQITKMIVVAGALGLAAQAQAALTITATINGSPEAGTSLLSFGSLPNNGANGASDSTGGTVGGVAVSFSPDAGAVLGSVANVNAAPWVGGSGGAADANVYLTSGSEGGPSTGAAATLTFSSPQTYLGLLWGSVDSYNTLSFYNGSTLVATVGGQDVLNANSGITASAQGFGGTAYVNIDGIPAFTSVVATSSQYAFEFDNVAYSAVPEPSTMISGALLLLPFGASTLRILRKNRAA